MQGGDRKHREHFPPPDYISAADLVFGLLCFQSNFFGFRLCPYISLLLKPLWQFFIDLAPLRMLVMYPYKTVRTTLTVLQHYIPGHQNPLLHFYENLKIACSGNFLLFCIHFCVTWWTCVYALSCVVLFLVNFITYTVVKKTYVSSQHWMLSGRLVP
jgi:hypothetical protein